MRVLITGGAGFVGSRLAKRFQDSSHEVIVFDNLRRRGSELNLSKFEKHGIKFIHGDIRCREDFESIPGNFDLFIEASAEPSVMAGLNESTAYLTDTNLVGTSHCLEFSKGRVGYFQFLSTSRVYSIEALKTISLSEKETRFSTIDLPSEGVDENFSTKGFRSFYGTSKLASELLVEEFCEANQMAWTINRCGVICGAGQFGKVDQGVFTLWLANHFFRKPLKYLGFGGTGKQVRDLLHPDDLFSLLEIQIENKDKASKEIFNIGGGIQRSISLQELTQLCAELTSHKVDISSVKETHRFDVPYYVTNFQKAKNLLHWEPKISNIEMFKDILEWIKKNESLLSRLF